MRTWVYTYKTSDGLRHEGEMGAPDKDSVYAALRERGIRAIKVTERIQPVVRKGFKGLRKRDVVCLVLCALCLVGGVWFFASRSTPPPAPIAQAIAEGLRTPHKAQGTLTPLPRHQIEGFDKIDLAAVFENPSEAYLTRYAQPGFVPCASCLVPCDSDAQSTTIPADLIEHLKTPITIMGSDSAAVIELKRTVEGVKADIALMLTSGRGINDILAWLDERQKMEAEHREKIAANVRRGVTGFEQANQILRTMGLEELPKNSKIAP